MQGYWEFKTHQGTFRIVPTNGRYQAFYENEGLGFYHSAEAALDDLVGGHTFLPSNGLDPSTCGLPADISEWTFIRGS
jgi:hypothetical protein